MKKAEAPTTYFIPANYSPEGTILSGTFKLRNAIEAAICVLAVAGPLIYYHPFPVQAIAILVIVFSLPLGILALMGVNDGSLFEYIGDVIHYFFSNKNIVFFSVYQHEQAEKAKEAKGKQKKGSEQK